MEKRTTKEIEGFCVRYGDKVICEWVENGVPSYYLGDNKDGLSAEIFRDIKDAQRQADRFAGSVIVKAKKVSTTITSIEFTEL